ncbi:MAG TPA: ATP phosphoribosyltransferase, partial [Planctomycetaceae bacterium]|nr:ATP phosphoribosyltransferase [Planctomycetaceae bacterium]
ILDEVLQSTTRFIANRTAYQDAWTKNKLDNISLMLRSCLAAEGKVGIMMNVQRKDMEAVLAKLPALQTPTVSSLSDPDWVAVNTIVDESLVRAMMPELRSAGARGIVEYGINKIID